MSYKKSHQDKREQSVAAAQEIKWAGGYCYSPNGANQIKHVVDGNTGSAVYVLFQLTPADFQDYPEDIYKRAKEKSEQFAHARYGSEGIKLFSYAAPYIKLLGHSSGIGDLSIEGRVINNGKQKLIVFDKKIESGRHKHLKMHAAR